MSGGCAASLVARLGEQARRTVEGAIAPGSPCALLGYPNHTNPGDHAVWLGAKSILARLECEIVYECSWQDYSRDALVAAAEDGALIVFTGGGNFGDLWPATQGLRERVLQDFRGVPVVQLQQSVHFERSENAERMRKLLERHGNTSLLVRDLPSLELARRSFGVDIALGPDLAFACPLGAGTRTAPTVDVLWIARQDRESRGLGPWRAPSGAWRIDWNLRDNELRPIDGEAPLPRTTIELIDRNRSLTKSLAAGRADPGSMWRELSMVRAQLTHRRLERACGLLARGRVIVTDSLHAHILGLMLGIPTVATDNSYGKLRGTFETFTHDSPITSWAETPSEALTVASELLKESSREASAAGRDPLARWRLPHSHQSA